MSFLWNNVVITVSELTGGYLNCMSESCKSCQALLKQNSSGWKKWKNDQNYKYSHTKLCGVTEVAGGIISFKRSINNVKLINVSYLGNDTRLLMN